MPLLEKGRLSERQMVELGDIIIGRHPGRTSPEQITIFESQGMAIQDIAVAVRLLVFSIREMILLSVWRAMGAGLYSGNREEEDIHA